MVKDQDASSGQDDGAELGSDEGCGVGEVVGKFEGDAVGDEVGKCEGDAVGENVVGDSVGDAVERTVGEAVGDSVTSGGLILPYEAGMTCGACPGYAHATARLSPPPPSFILASKK